MNVETIEYYGWQNNLRIFNNEVEVIVTLEVGPRVLGYRHLPSGENVFAHFPKQLGKVDETEWCIRGGHRLWLAPEHPELSYHLDNQAVSWRRNDTTGEVLIDSVLESPHRIRKTLGLLLADNGSRVTARHLVTNEGSSPITVATWALSVMQPGGLEIIPQPALGEHPRDLLPNRGMVLWPYTDLSDPRLTFGQKFWMLRQAEDYLPTKLGLAHREKWIGYVLNDSLYLKTFDHVAGANYPDGGCNFETFTNTEMLEIESLGPLVTLEPGQSTEHFEKWHVFPLTEQTQIESEESLAQWLAPFLDQILS